VDPEPQLLHEICVEESMDDELQCPLPPQERDFLDAAKAGDVAKLRELRAKGAPVDVLDNVCYPVPPGDRPP